MSDTTTQIIPRHAQSEVDGPEENFTGRVSIRGLFAREEPSRLTGAIVTFEPGARSARIAENFDIFDFELTDEQHLAGRTDPDRGS